MLWHLNDVMVFWLSLKTGPAGARKIALVITTVDFDEFSLYSTGASLFSNHNIRQTQPVATLLHALKGQTLAPFNLG